MEEGINTWIHCPHRIEYIKTVEEVEKGDDWMRGLCPNGCPTSPRNADYSACLHPSFGFSIPKEPGCHSDDAHIEFPACRVAGGGMVSGNWCEAIVLNKKCPMHFVR